MIEVPPSPLAELGLRLEGLEFAEQPVVVVAVDVDVVDVVDVAVVVAALVEEAAVAGGTGMPPASAASTQQHLYY